MTKARTVADLGGGVPDPFNPVAVTGTTPSLDLGSYNFFDNGTITAATTVSFSNVPTNARWDYSFKVGLQISPWDITAFEFKQKFDASANASASRDIYFKPDGTGFYLACTGTDKVHQYNLSTAWDVSTATHFGSVDVSGRDSSINGVFFKSDGTKMYMSGATNKHISEFNLSTAWNITTASYYQDFNVSSQDATPTGLFFKPDGTKLFVCGLANQRIYMYTLSTAWDISTMSFSAQFSHGLSIKDVYFKDDGLRFYAITGTASGNEVREYTVPSAYTIGTGETYVRSVFVHSPDTVPRGVFFDGDGGKLYVSDSTEDIYEYNLGSAASVTLPSSVETLPPTSLVVGKRATYEFFTMDGGTTVKVIGEEVV